MLFLPLLKCKVYIMTLASIQQFLHMGGYAAYVWPAYGITFMVLIGNIALPLLGKKPSQ
jgi:heme exporter protein CcmD